MNEVKSVYYSNETDRKQTHYHDCHQIILIAKGQVRITVDGKSFEAGEKSLIVFSRYENHSIEVLSPEYERYVLRVNPVSDSLYSILSCRPHGFSNLIPLNDSFGKFRTVFEKLVSEYSSTLEHRDEMLDILCRQIIIMLDRTFPQYERNELVSSVQHRLELDFSESFTISSLAAEFSVSPSKLSHEFKRVTGWAVMEYLTSCRIASAKAMLTKTALEIGEIVERCGFSDSSNFSRTFKRMTGSTPSQFRKRY